VHVAQDQHFTCAQCGRCCRRATVPVTPGEADAYRKAGTARWFRGSGDSNGGATIDPFEPIPGHEGLLQIRKRPDGACGFLSADGLCRIHEELGFERKPIACRVFPFRFHPVDGDVVATSSFSCPTIIANEGAPLTTQTRDIQALYLAWKREQPEVPATVQLVDGYPLPRSILPKLRTLLLRVLDTPGPDGAFDLAASLRRIAAFLDDLSRPRVLKLNEHDLLQYFEVMSRHVLTVEALPAARDASWLTRALFRGLLLSAMSVQLHLDPVLGKRPMAIRLALFRLLAHLHSVAPGNAAFNLRTARAVSLDVTDDAVREVATHYLRSLFETIGTGRRAVVEEVSMAVAHLNAACVFARIHAAGAGQGVAGVASFTQGLLVSADLAQADDGGMFSRALTAFSGGIDALYLFPASTI